MGDILSLQVQMLSLSMDSLMVEGRTQSTATVAFSTTLLLVKKGELHPKAVSTSAINMKITCASFLLSREIFFKIAIYNWTSFTQYGVQFCNYFLRNRLDKKLNHLSN